MADESPKPLGQWLVNNLKNGGEMELPNRKEPDREINLEPSPSGEKEKQRFIVAQLRGNPKEALQMLDELNAMRL